MKITIADIKNKTVELSEEEPVKEYSGLVAMEGANECRFLAPLHIQLTVAKEHELVKAHGTVATRVRLSCARCLAEYETDIDSLFTIYYTKSNGEPLDEEVELTEEDLVSASYEGDEIDFSPVIEEQVLMGIPLKPLCKEECLGLCSTCGADLNSDPCRCDRLGQSLKFSALQNLKLDK